MPRVPRTYGNALRLRTMSSAWVSCPGMVAQALYVYIQCPSMSAGDRLCRGYNKAVMHLSWATVACGSPGVIPSCTGLVPPPSQALGCVRVIAACSTGGGKGQAGQRQRPLLRQGGTGTGRLVVESHRPDNGSVGSVHPAPVQNSPGSRIVHHEKGWGVTGR